MKIKRNNLSVMGLPYHLIKIEMLGLIIPAFLSLFSVFAGMAFIAFSVFMLINNKKKKEAFAVASLYFKSAAVVVVLFVILAI